MTFENHQKFGALCFLCRNVGGYMISRKRICEGLLILHKISVEELDLKKFSIIVL